jgi:hypothetical protein
VKEVLCDTRGAESARRPLARYPFRKVLRCVSAFAL